LSSTWDALRFNSISSRGQALLGEGGLVEDPDDVVVDVKEDDGDTFPSESNSVT
jgi:hypothetical protein